MENELSLDELTDTDISPADADEAAEDEGMEGLNDAPSDAPEKSDAFLVEMPEDQRQAEREKFFAEMELDPYTGAKRGFLDILAGASDMQDFH